MDFASFLIQTLNSLQYGLLLFLVASGLTLVFGIMGIINLAHGSFYMIGAYLAFVLTSATGSLVMAIVLGIPLALDQRSRLEGRTLASSYAPLFTRIDPKHIDAMIDASKDTLAAAPVAQAAPAKKPEAAPVAKQDPNAPAHIGIDDFAKLDLRIGRVLECGFVEGSDKLLRFLLDAGELGQRQIFSGIRASYGEPDKLVGRNVVFIANLAPRKMRFGTSEGMILSAGFDGGGLSLLDADAGAQPGMPVK